jgi:aspartate/methionine/tyrosine aminotransferase
MTTKNLTHIEKQALRSPINLADGHARQSLHPATLEAVVDRFRAVVHGAIDVAGVETEFLDAFTARSHTPYDENKTWICYSASIAIDIVAKLLTRRGLRVGLVTPTFDNLSALIDSNGAELIPVPEEILVPQVDFDRLSALALDSLVVVMPNNPTGTSWDVDQWSLACSWAARSGVVLVGDMSFRLFDRAMCWDQLALAESHGASLILIEDTGKIVPLHDTKVGVITCTKDLAADLNEIHESVLLNCSSIDLALITVVLGDSHSKIDEIERARSLVRMNRKRVRDHADRLGLSALSMGDLSVEWVDVGPAKYELVGACMERGLIVLPGEYFHWNETDVNQGAHRIRLALMRDEDVIQDGLARMSEALESLHSPALS